MTLVSITVAGCIEFVGDFNCLAVAKDSKANGDGLTFVVIVCVT